MGHHWRETHFQDRPRGPKRVSRTPNRVPTGSTAAVDLTITWGTDVGREVGHNKLGAEMEVLRMIDNVGVLYGLHQKFRLVFAV